MRFRDQADLIQQFVALQDTLLVPRIIREAEACTYTLFTLFPIVGFAAAWSTWQFFRHPPADRRWWWYEHFGGMIASGIAAHTAFGAFGIRRLFPELQLGPWGLMPWIAPSAQISGASSRGSTQCASTRPSSHAGPSGSAEVTRSVRDG